MMNHQTIGDDQMLKIQTLQEKTLKEQDTDQGIFYDTSRCLRPPVPEN